MYEEEIKTAVYWILEIVSLNKLLPPETTKWQSCRSSHTRSWLQPSCLIGLMLIVLEMRGVTVDGKWEKCLCGFCFFVSGFFQWEGGTGGTGFLLRVALLGQMFLQDGDAAGLVFGALWELEVTKHRCSFPKWWEQRGEGSLSPPPAEIRARRCGEGDSGSAEILESRHKCFPNPGWRRISAPQSLLLGFSSCCEYGETTRGVGDTAGDVLGTAASTHKMPGSQMQSLVEMKRFSPSSPAQGSRVALSVSNP